MFYRKPHALPRPRTAEILPQEGHYETVIRDMLLRRRTHARELGQIDAQIQYILNVGCTQHDVAQDVELYKGDLGVTREFVDRHQSPVGQLQWRENLDALFVGDHDDAGNVSGERWGSGALIADDLFLTAGHCFDQFPTGFEVPTHLNVPLSPWDLAKLMQVNFNYQIDGRSHRLKPGVSFPVAGMIELDPHVDYAILKLGTNAAGKKPGELFGHLKVAKADPDHIGKMLCIIQHPSRRPKMIEAGPMSDARAGRIAYDSIDTAGGASGAPILTSPEGEVVGVHLRGGCYEEGGLSFGAAVSAMRQVSKVLKAM